MNYSASIILLSTLSILFVSCTTSRPVFSDISEPDYNGRRTVEYPAYQKKLNPIGYGAIAISTAGGAYLGYNGDIIKTKNEAGVEESNKTAGLILGGLAGYAVSAFGNRLIAKKDYRRRIKRGEELKWTRKFGSEYTPVNFDSRRYELVIINKAAEPRYQIKEYHDLEDFYSAFPSSQNTKKVFTNAIDVVTRSQLIDIINLDKNNPASPKARLAYFDRSRNLDELLEAAGRFPSVNYPIEDRGVELVLDVDEAVKFLERFPNSRHKKKVFINSLYTAYEKNDIPRILNLIGPVNFSLNRSDLRDSSSRYHQNYFTLLLDTKKFSSSNEALDFMREYSWISYPRKHKDQLAIFWDINYSKYSDGNQLVALMRSLANQDQYKHLSLSLSQIDGFLGEKLLSEGQNKIKVISSDVMNSRNFDFEYYGGLYDAPLVTEDDGLSYLYYGTIRNDSKFDLPVNLKVNAIQKSETEAGLLGFNFLKSTEIEGYRSVMYSIPNLPAGQTMPFAALFELKGVTGTGINILVSGKSQTILENFSVDPGILMEPVNQKKLELQRKWLVLSKNGFSNQSKVYDRALLMPFWKKEYNPDDYVIDWSSMDEEKGDSNCGCNIIKDKAEKDLWTGDINWYRIEMENGYEYYYSIKNNGDYSLHDGIMGAFRSSFNSKEKMISYILDDCRFYKCR